MTGNDDEMFMTRSLIVTPWTTEQHLIARSAQNPGDAPLERGVNYMLLLSFVKISFFLIQKSPYILRGLAGVEIMVLIEFYPTKRQ